MPDVKAKIHYLYHSGFAVETSEHFLIFDYCLDKAGTEKKGLNDGIVTPHEISVRKNPVVFVSHSHGDHYNPIVLEWQEYNDDIRYIFSADVSCNGEKIHSLKPFEVLKLNDLSIETFGSTDQGVSFFITVDGLTIFHAGDLNWWHWKEESTDEEVKKSEEDFLKEIQPIIGKKIDIAFFPVDPRLGSDYALGALRFMWLLKPSMLVPMHFGDKYETAAEFSLKSQDCNTTVPMILKRGQTIWFRKQI